jgi:Tfp pilus assembly protein PilE
MTQTASRPIAPIPAPRRVARGMTLMELMVIVLILSVLVALGVSAGPGLFRTLSKQQTTATMKVLEAVLTEFRSQTGKTVQIEDDLYNTQFWASRPANTRTTTTTDTASLAIGSSAEFVARAIERLLSITYSNDPRSAMTPLFAPLNSDTLTDRPDLIADPSKPNQTKSDIITYKANKMLEIRDVWGHKIIYKHDPNDGASGEYKYDNFLPRSRRPYFASSGPDGKFGSDPNGVDRAAGNQQANAADNIYSFDLDK